MALFQYLNQGRNSILQNRDKINNGYSRDISGRMATPMIGSMNLLKVRICL